VARIYRNITTVAGGGLPFEGRGDGGPATSVHLFLSSVAVDQGGNLINCLQRSLDPPPVRSCCSCSEPGLLLKISSTLRANAVEVPSVCLAFAVCADLRSGASRRLCGLSTHSIGLQPNRCGAPHDPLATFLSHPDPCALVRPSALCQ